jgi:hypothetical protein
MGLLLLEEMGCQLLLQEVFGCHRQTFASEIEMLNSIM